MEGNCAYCDLSTSGAHQKNCPLYERGEYEVSEIPISQPFASIYIRCPHCKQEMKFDGFPLSRATEGKEG